MPGSFEILRHPDKQSATAEAGEYLNKLLIDNKSGQVLLMLSAGSSLSVLDYIGQTALGENLTVSMMDERFSRDPAANNFAQLQKTDFYQTALGADVNFFGTLPRPGETMEDLAKRWEVNLRQWRQKNPQGTIVGTLGMGADGHTAGILPYPESREEFHRLFENKNWIQAYNAGGKSSYKERITATLTFLKLVDFALGFVCGAEKKEKFDGMASKKGALHELPALAWHEIKNVKVFTDIN